MSTGLVLSEGSEGESVLHCLLIPGSFLTTFGVPWLIEALLQSVPSSSHDVLPICVGLQISPV